MKDDPCEKCQEKARIDGQRFCFGCRAKYVSEMWKAGYLKPLPSFTRQRNVKQARDDETEWGLYAKAQRESEDREMELI